MATINVVCYKSKTLKNGEHPIMLRVTKDRQTKYRSLGISIHPDYWDFKKNKPKANYPNKDILTEIILKKELELRKQLLELQAKDCNFTASTLLLPKKKKYTKTVNGFCKEVIEELKEKEKIGNVKVYKDCFNFLNNFTEKKLDIPFSYIDVDFLENFENWMRERNFKETSMSVLFRTLRSIYNKAIKSGAADKDSYPFSEFKISKFNTKTIKRALSKEDILKIMNVDLDAESKKVQLSRDIFIFSYLCGGINMTDICDLKSTNIIEDGRNEILTYKRNKTDAIINLPLSEQAVDIKNFYKKYSYTDYLFPFLNDNKYKTAYQIYNKKKRVLKNVNSNIKIVANIAKINNPNSITTYTARHSYATILKNSGVNIALIGETLGHTNLKTTQIYLDSFNNKQIKKALNNLV